MRAFFALELDDVARASCVACVDALRERPGGDDVRWVKPANLHVTLRFLGSVAASHVEGLLDRVAERIAPLSPFALRLGALAAFPTARRPRVVVREIPSPEPLQRLASAVEDGVRSAGFEAEQRRFRPHLTLGRVRRRQATLPDVTGVDTPVSETFGVTEIVLFRSELQPAGSRYTALARLPLGSAAAARSSSPLSRPSEPSEPSE